MRILSPLLFALLYISAFHVYGLGAEPGASASSSAWHRQDDGKKKKDKKDKKDKKGKDKDGKQAKAGKGKNTNPSPVTALQQWELPAELKEISGMTWAGENKVACIQDEDGIIFVYDLAAKKVTEQLKFGDAGDYEGITMANGIFYVLRSDGTLFEVDPRTPAKAAAYKTGFTTAHDCEGLEYDTRSKRLLIGFKERDPKLNGRKGIYAFDLQSKKTVATPVASIDLGDQVFAGEKNPGLLLSDLAVHPGTGKIYLLNGPKSMLLVISGQQIEGYHTLNRSELPQPEGIMFSPEGDLYISSEGGKGNGILMKCKLAP